MRKIKRRIKVTEFISLMGICLLPLLMLASFLMEPNYQSYDSIIILIMGLIIFELSMYIKMENLKKEIRKLKAERIGARY